MMQEPEEYNKLFGYFKPGEIGINLNIETSKSSLQKLLNFPSSNLSN